jgi:hypothetical protein
MSRVFSAYTRRGLVLYLTAILCGAGSCWINRPASAQDIISHLNGLVARASELKIGFCSKSFDDDSCKQFLDDAVGKRLDLSLVQPAVEVGDASQLPLAELLARCDLSFEKHPFRFEDERGNLFLPSGPFRLYDGALGRGKADDVILAASGYRSPDDPKMIPFSWVGYFFVPARSPCDPANYSFLWFGNPERPTDVPQEDAVVLWRGKPFILTLDRLARDPGIDLYDAVLTQLEHPELQQRSGAVSLYITVKRD